MEILAYSAFDRRHYREVRQAIQRQVEQRTVFYHPLLNEEEDEIYTSLYTYIEQHGPSHAEADARLLHHLAMGCMREDVLVMKQLEAWHMDPVVLQKLCRDMNEENVRAGYCRAVESLMHNVVQDPKKRYAKSERIDAFVLHKWLGLPLFLLVFPFFCFSSFRPPPRSMIISAICCRMCWLAMFPLPCNGRRMSCGNFCCREFLRASVVYLCLCR